jgi:formiminotetrahydrofolate cyclodeaminase
MRKLADAPLRDLLTAFASPSPTPAGGAASALVSAVGVSLLMMAAALPKTRSGSDEERQLLTANSLVLTGLQHQLTGAIDQDAQAYRQVIAARGDELQDAIRKATDAPLQVMRLSTEALKTAPGVAARCYRPASSDVRVGIALLRAGFTGARSSVQANLRRVSDGRYRDAVQAEVDRLSVEAGVALDPPHSQS